MLFSIGLVIIGFVAIAIFLLMKKNKVKSDEKAEKFQEAYDKTKSPEFIEATINKMKKELLDMNISLRENVSSKEIINSFETVIDSLIAIYPISNDPAKYSRQTVIVNRMSTDYLPKVLHSYLILPFNSKDAGEKTILNILSQVKEQLDAVKQSYETSNQEEFERNTRIIETMFAGYVAEAKGDTL